MAVPGSFVGIWLIPRLGRKRTMLFGLSAMLTMFVLLALFVGSLPTWLFTMLFGLQLTFDRVGPCPLSFIFPAELLPTAVRATGLGICAAAGKCGAILGAYVVGVLKTFVGINGMFAVIAAITAVEIMWVALLI